MSFLLIFSNVLHYRPFAPLIRDAKYTESFILFLFSERAKRNKPMPLGPILLNSINPDTRLEDVASK